MIAGFGGHNGNSGKAMWTPSAIISYTSSELQLHSRTSQQRGCPTLTPLGEGVTFLHLLPFPPILNPYLQQMAPSKPCRHMARRTTFSTWRQVSERAHRVSSISRQLPPESSQGCSKLPTVYKRKYVVSGIKALNPQLPFSISVPIVYPEESQWLVMRTWW